MKANTNNGLLSEEQMELRRSGIGASEIAAVCGISPWSSALDVWMRKATATRDPLIGGGIDTMATRIGNALEEPLRLMYEMQTGLSVSKPDITFRHPLHPFILATPDGLLDFVPDMPAKGLEIKNVGARMVRAWEEAETESGVPDYVEMQCRQNMAVLGYETWDVAALLGGSDFRIFTVQRDLELENVMIDAARNFWEEYVIGDTPPPESDPERQRALLAALFPKNADKEYKVPPDPELFNDLCLQLQRIGGKIKVLSGEKTDTENALIAMVGDDYGIEGKAGKFCWGLQNGSASYKDIAVELAGGKIPDELIEKHRSAPKRVARFYPAK